MRAFTTFTNLTSGISILIILLVLLAGLMAYQRKTSQDTGQEAAQQQAETAGSETKTITDHAGNIVEIPIEPKRIASLHTLTTSVMLFDLNAPLIGVSTRLKKDQDNRPYIRGVEELYGVRFQDTQLFNYGKFGEDIEQIKLSKPDLIVGRVKDLKNYEKLSAIAPTVLIDGSHTNMYVVFKDLASWVGKADEFQQKDKVYKKRVEALKTRFSKNPKEQTIGYMHPYKGKASYLICRGYGAFTIAAYDLGFKILPFVEQQISSPGSGGMGGKCTKLSAETFGEFNPDWILTTYRHQFGETPDDIYIALDDIAPGWKNYNSAYKNKQIIIMNRAKTMTSFQALNEVLDVFEQMAK